MPILLNVEELRVLKGKDLVNIECDTCHGQFTREKWRITKALSKNPNNKFICSTECIKLSKTTKVQCTCKFCGISFMKTKGQIEKTKNNFCTRSCAAKFNNQTPKRKIQKKCIVCNEIVQSHKHTRCPEHQKEYLATRFDYIKELTLQDYWSKKSLENLHVSSKNAHIRGLGRTQFKELLLQPCANCGYDKHVELCHIKPVKDFLPTDKIKDVNSPDNVIQLCPNCHWEFDNNLLLLSDIR